MRETNEFITIRDFSPGIHSDYHATDAGTPAETTEGSVLRDGAATIEDTARCCADLSGALVPLPKLIAGKTSNPLPTADNDDTLYLPSGSDHSWLMDAVVKSDMYVQGDENAIDEDRAGVFVMYGQAWHATGDPTVHKWTVIAQLHRLFEGSSSSDQHDIMYARCNESMNASSPIQIGSGNFVFFKGRTDLTDPTYDAVVWVAYGSPGYVAYNGPEWESGTIAASEQAVTDFDTVTGTTYPGAYGRVIGIYPDPNDNDYQSGFMDNTYGGVEGANFTGACWLVAHQGRIVGLTRTGNRMGTNGGDTYRSIAEQVWYTPVQDFYAELGLGCYESAQFAEEKSDRTGAVASITADEIIFIRDRGGAVLVRGDLDNPTVVQLPYVESTHGARSIPVSCPLGLVYGTRNGVYLWEGGDVSRPLSPQIEGWFWNHAPNALYLGVRGRFGWWNPWVCVPNSYLYDTRNESWWRLDSPANTGEPFNVYDVPGESNRLYAFPYRLTDTQNTMWYTATPDVLCDDYTWKSQPLVQSRRRVVTVQEVHLTVTPGSTIAATVDVTLSGFDHEGNAVTPVTVTFNTNNNTNVQMLHKDVVANFQASHIQVRIEANANSSNHAAPKIHEVSLSVNNRARIPKS